MRLSVRPGGAVFLTVPHSISDASIEKFLTQHTEWIERARAKMARLKPLPASGKREYKARRIASRHFVHTRVTHWNSFYNFKYGRIAIKNTKTLWGSCSKKGNLNFSYALIHLPRELADYVIVHELCHLQEHNHSPRFWELVAHTQPNYLCLRRDLRTYVLRS